MYFYYVYCLTLLTLFTDGKLSKQITKKTTGEDFLLDSHIFPQRYKYLHIGKYTRYIYLHICKYIYLYIYMVSINEFAI